MIAIVVVYRFECDWALGCRAILTLHGCESQEEAKDRARRDDWTISKTRRGHQHVRCPRHAYRFVSKPTGRPRRTMKPNDYGPDVVARAS